MKNSFKLTALLVVLSTGLFAATPVKTVAPAKKDLITFSSLPSHAGVDIKVEKSEPGKSIVIIYDKDDNVLLKDVIPAYKSMEKGYILNKLDDGDYKIEVTSNKQVVTKDIHVYNEDKTKVFIVKQ
jgi:hypothetical protein